MTTILALIGTSVLMVLAATLAYWWWLRRRLEFKE